MRYDDQIKISITVTPSFLASAYESLEALHSESGWDWCLEIDDLADMLMNELRRGT